MSVVKWRLSYVNLLKKSLKSYLQVSKKLEKSLDVVNKYPTSVQNHNMKFFIF
jgi:hypothetical protein